MTASVQAMSENINYFNEGRYIWPDLYRATGRSSQGVLIKTLRTAKENMKYTQNNNRYRKYYMEAKANLGPYIWFALTRSIGFILHGRCS